MVEGALSGVFVAAWIYAIMKTLPFLSFHGSRHDTPDFQ